MANRNRRIVRSRRHGATQDRAVRNLDQLIAFEGLIGDLGPGLVKDVRNGLSADEIYKKYTTLAAARTVAIVAKEKNNTTALAAIKEILDRTQGKATEKKEVQHRFAHLPEKELDAVLNTELEELSLLESPGDDE